MLFYSERPPTAAEEKSHTRSPSGEDYRIPLRPREPQVNVVPALNSYPRYSSTAVRTSDHRRVSLSPTGCSPTTSYFPPEQGIENISAPSTAPSSPRTPLNKQEFGDLRIRRDSCKTEAEFEEKPTVHHGSAGSDSRIKLPGIRDLFRDEWDLRQGRKEPTSARQPDLSHPHPPTSVPNSLHHQQQYQHTNPPVSPFTSQEPFSAFWGQRRPYAIDQAPERRHSTVVQRFHDPREPDHSNVHRMAWQRRSMQAVSPASLRYHPAAAPRHVSGGSDILHHHHHHHHHPPHGHVPQHHTQYSGVKKNKGHCNIRYDPEQMDFILYHFMDKGLSWNEVVARYDAKWPNGVKRDRQGLQGVFYRWNTKIPVLDNDGKLVFKPNGWIKRMAIPRRKQDKVGCKRDYGLVKRCPENAMKHEWVDAEDRRVAAELVRERDRQREAEAQRRLALGLPIRTKEDDDENQPTSPMQVDASFESSDGSLVMDIDDDEPPRFVGIGITATTP